MKQPGALDAHTAEVSPPARGRGLKRYCPTLVALDAYLSPPARGRGLKHLVR